jgi:hypothetical protein
MAKFVGLSQNLLTLILFSDHLSYMASGRRFAQWTVTSETYCNMVFISRNDLREAIVTMWPQVRTGNAILWSGNAMARY